MQNNLQKRFEEIVSNEFEPLSLGDYSGVVRRGYGEKFGEFKSVENIGTSDGRTLEREGMGNLYRNAILVLDWFFGYEISLPFVGGSYVYKRLLKHTELKEFTTPRFVNAVVSHKEGVPTPRPLALLGTSDRAYYVSEFSGAHNVMHILGKNFSFEDRRLQIEASESSRDFWSLEEKLSQKYNAFPSIQEIGEIVGFGKNSLDLLDWEVKFGKETYKGVPPSWISTLALFAERISGEVDYKGYARDLNAYISARNRDLSVQERFRKNKEKRPLRDILSVAHNIGIALQRASDSGFLLYEVAPRDIVIDTELNVKFADTEQIEWIGKSLSGEERVKQFELLEGEFPKVRSSKKPSSMRRFSLRLFIDEIRKAYFS